VRFVASRGKDIPLGYSTYIRFLEQGFIHLV